MVKQYAKLLPLVLLVAAFGSYASDSGSDSDDTQNTSTWLQAYPKTKTGLKWGGGAALSLGSLYLCRKPVTRGVCGLGNGITSGASWTLGKVKSGKDYVLEKAKENPKTAIGLGAVATVGTLYGLNRKFQPVPRFQQWRADRKRAADQAAQDRDQKLTNELVARLTPGLKFSLAQGPSALATAAGLAGYAPADHTHQGALTQQNLNAALHAYVTKDEQAKVLRDLSECEAKKRAAEREAERAAIKNDLKKQDKTE